MTSGAESGPAAERLAEWSDVIAPTTPGAHDIGQVKHCFTYM
jgi:hypothetical protein